MKCANCNIPITTRQPRVVEVTGWVQDRKAGGINQVRKAEPTGKVLCPECGLVFWSTGQHRQIVNTGQMELV